MVVLRLGKVNNLERKFIPTKKEYLKKYLDGMKEIEQYELLQTYKDGYKYRRYNDDGDLKYTRNNKMSEITHIEEITEKSFDEALRISGKAVRKIRKYYIDGDFEIDVDCFLEPNDMIMVEVSSDKAPLEDYIPPKGFIEVTGNKTYENYGIYNDSIKSNNTIIEGTDGVGKTITIKELIKQGIICQDRCTDVISKKMLFDVPMEERVFAYQDYLKQIDKKVIIMINNDQDELEKRISKREVLSEYDLDAFKYNKLYEETFLYMKKHNMLENKMFLVDCTGLTIEEQVEQVKNIILGDHNA